MKINIKNKLDRSIKKAFIVSTLIFFSMLTIFLSACRSRPAELEIPEFVFHPLRAEISFDTIEADTPEMLNLFFTLELENINDMDIPVVISSWEIEVNGSSTLTGFSSEFPNEVFNEAFIVEAHDSVLFPITLEMNVPLLINRGLAPQDEYEIRLIINYEYFDNQSLQRTFVEETAVFPGVVRPEFNITAIAILQAELVNTGFRVGISIQNDNPYPVELAAFSYTLYGDGMLWADGSERNIIGINGKTTLRGNIFLVMNFIDMSRSLLDQIIMLEDVNYRFTGEAVVHTGVYYLPSFVTDFDLRGYSVVLGE